MPIAFQIEYKDDYSEMIYSDQSKQIHKEWLNTNIIDVASSLRNNFVPVMIEYDILGNKKDGYDCNDVLSKDKIYSVDEFINYLNLASRKLLLKRSIKQAKNIFGGYHKDGIAYDAQNDD